MKCLLAALSLSLSFLPAPPAGAQNIALSQLASPVSLSVNAIQSDPHTDVVRLMHTYLDAWADHFDSPKAYADLFGDHATLELPHADNGDGLALTGRDTLVAGLGKLSATAEDWQFSALRVYYTSFPNIFYVEYFAGATAREGSATNFGRHLARVTIEDGRIADYYELWDQGAESIALGCVVR